jgi:hypothetical protein
VWTYSTGASRGIPNAFTGLNNSFGTTGTAQSVPHLASNVGNQSFVLQGDYNTAKNDIEEAVWDLQAALINLGNSLTNGTTDTKVDRALQPPAKLSLMGAMFSAHEQKSLIG